MATDIDKLFKGFSIKEIEDILFNTAVGVKKIKKRRPVNLINIREYKVKERVTN
ncbi:MAG: hypothetical protein HND50_18100 [Calditrichaeota bacterium]|nr:hypothetical protein [Calditrichota bacterium]